MDGFRQLTGLLKEIGLAGFVDMAIMTLVIYSLLVWLKRSRQAFFVLTGVIIVTVIYTAARLLNLQLTVAALHGFFTIFLFALVVLFQEELRYFLEHIAVWWFNRRPHRARAIPHRIQRREVEILARALGDLARGRIGALVVLRGKDVLARHLEGGEEVKGLISEALLKSIFDPHSLGHDGAVIIEGGLIDRLGCHLPLSKNLGKLGRSGTRHAAALGLAERTDALCLVVSEERGTISIARQGEMRLVEDPAHLIEALGAFYDEISPPPESRPWQSFLRKNTREKAIAIGLALLLWLGLVYRSHVIYESYHLTVQPSQLPSELAVARLDPSEVKATFSGPRKAFVFLRPEDIKLSLKLWDAKPGDLEVHLSSMDLSFPSELTLEDIEPRVVRVRLDQKPKAAPSP